jgi:hypothetical protein
MPDPVRETSWQSPASLAPEEDLKSLLLSERSGDSEKAIGTLVGLLSSRIEEKRARGYALYREALEEALYRSCLNYRSLVRGFTHPLLSVMEQAIESWADAPRRKASAEENMTKVVVPPAVKAEHDELHAELAAATKLPGAVGAAAREVAKLLHPHFIKEEEFALPPLGLLMTIARGETVAGVPGNEAVVAMADRLKQELPEMLAEHAAILDALGRLATTARAEGDENRVRFAEKLAAHARIEEAVMYPAAILVGALVRQQLRNSP